MHSPATNLGALASAGRSSRPRRFEAVQMLHNHPHAPRHIVDRALINPSFIKKIGLFAVTLLVLGCGYEHSAAPADDQVLRIGGSTTMFPALNRGVALYRQNVTSLDFELTRTSSGQGLARLIAGELDIAASSRPPTPTEFRSARERAVALKTFQVALDGVTIIVHPEKARVLRSMSLVQARAIFFTGDIRDWSLVDPRLSGPITVYTRDPHKSGTAAAFIASVAGVRSASFVDDSTRLEHTDHIIPTVAGDPAGIGFVSLSQMDDRVVALDFGLDQGRMIPPSPRSVRDMSYQLRRDLFLVTNSTPRGQVNDFIRFMLSPSGQNVFNQLEMISIY